MANRRKILRWRTSKGQTQAQAAQTVGVSQPSISRAEMGTPLDPKIITKYVAASKGSLVRTDFREMSHTRKRSNGSKSKARRRQEARGRKKR